MNQNHSNDERKKSVWPHHIVHHAQVFDRLSPKNGGTRGEGLIDEGWGSVEIRTSPGSLPLCFGSAVRRTGGGFIGRERLIARGGGPQRTCAPTLGKNFKKME